MRQNRGGTVFGAMPRLPSKPAAQIVTLAALGLFVAVAPAQAQETPGFAKNGVTVGTPS